jgi:uncharacterized membrane protein YraQ (UPF0718 family)
VLLQFQGSILAVCSCTVYIFCRYLQNGCRYRTSNCIFILRPRINVLAIILTAKILGVELGIARAIGAVVFSIVIGLIMHLIFRKEEEEKAIQQAELPHLKSSIDYIKM